MKDDACYVWDAEETAASGDGTVNHNRADKLADLLPIGPYHGLVLVCDIGNGAGVRACVDREWCLPPYFYDGSNTPTCRLVPERFHVELLKAVKSYRRMQEP